MNRVIDDDFLYNGLLLSNFGMCVLPTEDDPQFVARDIERGDITSVRPKPNHYGAVYSDTFVLKFNIFLRDLICGDTLESRMSDFQIHAVRSWLESPKRPQRLTLFFADHDITTNYFGLFTEVEPYMVGGDCWGLMLTFTCDSPYGYADDHTEKYIINRSSRVVTGYFRNDSAELEEYQKPVITVYSTNVFGSNETLTITNVTDSNRSVTMTLPAGKRKLIMDVEKRMIYDENGNMVTMSDLGVTPTFNQYGFLSVDSVSFYWPSFIYGKNTLKFKGSSGNTIDYISITARDILKTGGY